MQLIIKLIEDKNKTVLVSEMEVKNIREAITALRNIIIACESILKKQAKSGLLAAKKIVDEMD